jgi:hypothetical protein
LILGLVPWIGALRDALLAGIIGGVSALVMLKRRPVLLIRDGLCPSCRYPLSASLPRTLCPECGLRLSPHAGPVIRTGLRSRYWAGPVGAIAGVLGCSVVLMACAGPASGPAGLVALFFSPLFIAAAGVLHWLSSRMTARAAWAVSACTFCGMVSGIALAMYVGPSSKDPAPLVLVSLIIGGSGLGVLLGAALTRTRLPSS